MHTFILHNAATFASLSVGGREEAMPGKLNGLLQGQTLLKSRDGSLDSFLTADKGILFPLSMLTI